jgi:hypothetical protein
MLRVNQAVESFHPFVQVSKLLVEELFQTLEKWGCLSDISVKDIHFKVALYYFKWIVKGLWISPGYLNYFFFNN